MVTEVGSRAVLPRYRADSEVAKIVAPKLNTLMNRGFTNSKKIYGNSVGPIGGIKAYREG